jgi:hypothetical protein
MGILVRAFNHDVATVQRLVAPFGGRVIRLLDGTLLVTFPTGSLRDTRARSASCALAIRAALLNTRVAIVSSQTGHPSGDALYTSIDAAALHVMAEEPADG